MAKSTKYTSKVPKIEDYKAPFVTGEGDEREVDVDAAIKVVHTLMLDKAKAQDDREDAKAELTERTAEVTDLQAKVDDKNAPDAQVEIAKANKRADEAEATAKTAVAEKTRLEVIVDKGLTPKQAKYLPKDGTQEELESAADEIKVDFPDVAKVETDDEREAREEAEAEAIATGRTTARPKPGINPNDPSGAAVVPVEDFEKAADAILGGQFKLV